LLSDGKPRRAGEVAEDLGFSLNTASVNLNLLWKSGKVLRTRNFVFEVGSSFHGRAGYKRNLRHYHLYLQRGDGFSPPVFRDGREYVGYVSRGRGKSKSQLVLDYLEDHKGGAYYSADIYDALKNSSVKKNTVSDAIRYYERKGLLFVRGYRSHGSKTPFQRGFLVTWVDQDKPRDVALKEALQRTEQALGRKVSEASLLERVRFIRDIVVSTTLEGDLTSHDYLYDQLQCSADELEYSMKRALQLYPELRTVKFFHNFRYYYHKSMPKGDLRAASMLKQNYIRKVKGRDNRIGHNWEAVAEWFVDKFMEGAKFLEQTHHRKGMDPRRITTYLVKNVGDRKNRAEVDRVWTVRTSPLAKPITYVLSCKYELIHKRDLDDFFNVLKYSKDFGVDTSEGRARKENVIGMFAGSTFDPNEKVKLPDGIELTLPSYAERLNIELLKASRLNEKLRERKVDKKITVQMICKAAKNEKEVRALLDDIWKTPEKAQEILSEAGQRNQSIYEFERQLKNGKDQSIELESKPDEISKTVANSPVGT